MDIYASSSYATKGIIEKVANVLREERATATNIESAVDKAGVDPNEVNATFGSMQALILEMTSDLWGTLMQPLQEHPTDRAVRDVLIEFGNRVASTYSVSHLVALYRIVFTEVTRHSGIGREFFERGPGRLTMCLAEYLEYSARRFGQLRIDNPKRLADNFLSLLRDNLDLSDAMTATRLSSAKNRSNAVVEAIELFFHGIVTEG